MKTAIRGRRYTACFGVWVQQGYFRHVCVTGLGVHGADNNVTMLNYEIPVSLQDFLRSELTSSYLRGWHARNIEHSLQTDHSVALLTDTYIFPPYKPVFEYAYT